MFNYDFSLSDDDIELEIKAKLIKLIETGNFKTLLTSSDLATIKKRYEEGIFSIYEDAKRKHESILNTGMPWWGWLVIAYTGYDDVWRFMTSSFFFPILLIICI